MALFSTSFFAKCLGVGEDGPGRGHLCHNDTFLVHFWMNLSKHQLIFVKLGMCIDIVEIWFRIANGRISSIFDRVICPNGGVL